MPRPPECPADAGPVIRLGVPADIPAASDVYRRASLSNAGDRDNLLGHPEHLVLGPEGLAEGRTYVAMGEGSLAGFATWSQGGGIYELEDLFVDPVGLDYWIWLGQPAGLGSSLPRSGNW